MFQAPTAQLCARPQNGTPSYHIAVSRPTPAPAFVGFRPTGELGYRRRQQVLDVYELEVTKRITPPVARVWHCGSAWSLHHGA